MENLNSPATKADLAALRADVEREFVDVRTELGALRVDLERKIDTFKEEIIHHFDVVVEKLRHDLLGANNDEIEVLKDGRADHERRIRRLERSAGVAA